MVCNVDACSKMARIRWVMLSEKEISARIILGWLVDKILDYDEL